jgi:hypothetical protein
MVDPDTSWPALPTETEIYILPNGEIVVADLPGELAAHLATLLPQNVGIAVEDSQFIHVPFTHVPFTHDDEQQHPTDPA